MPLNPILVKTLVGNFSPRILMGNLDILKNLA